MSEKLRQAAQQALEALEPYADIKPRDWKTDREKLWRSYDALRTALAEQPAEQEPVAWEWRWFDTSPYTVTSGQWSEWKRVEPRNSLCTLDDALNEFRAYIANGLRYELRAIYTAPQPAKQPLLADEICDSWEIITGHHQIQFGPNSEGRYIYLSPDEVIEFARAIEAAHGIEGQT